MLREDEKRNESPIFCVIDTSILLKYPDEVEMFSRALTRKEFDNKKGVYGKIVIPEVVKREVNDYFYHFGSKLTPEKREAKKQYSELIQRQEKRQKERKKILFWIKLKLFTKWATEQNLKDKKEEEELTKLEPEIKKMKDFSEKVKKAKVLIDRELRDNCVWMLKRENSDIIRILTTKLLNEPEVYKKTQKPKEWVENPASDSDLIILATAMQLSRHSIAFVVTRDNGLINATICINKKLGYRRVIAKRNVLGPWFKKRKQ